MKLWRRRKQQAATCGCPLPLPNRVWSPAMDRVIVSLDGWCEFHAGVVTKVAELERAGVPVTGAVFDALLRGEVVPMETSR